MRVAWSSAAGDRREKARLLALGSLVLLLATAGRLFYLQVLHGNEFRAMAQSNFRRPEVIKAMRGMIRDRNGTLLASSIPSFTVWIDPWNEAFRSAPGAPGRGRARLEETIGRLAPIVGQDPAELLDTVRRQMKISQQPVRVRRNADMTMVSVIAEHRHELPAVTVDSEPLRSYPFGKLGAHILGYLSEITDTELNRLRAQNYFPGAWIGRAGVERYYESELKGEDGSRFVEVNALGRRSNYFVPMPPILPKKGRDLTLTIDWNLQLAAETALDSAGWAGPSPAPEALGAVVAVDPRNGEVLALASRPSYDPNDFAGGISTARWQEYNQEGRYPLLNRAVQSRYPPGSTFKPVTLLAALTADKVSPSSLLHGCTGAYSYGSRAFRCWKAGGHGVSDAVRSLEVSCDVYYYQLGVMLGVDGIATMARRMHVADLTGIDLPQEKKGFVPDRAWYDRRFGPNGWSRGAALNLAIGQGEILLTPVELASLAATLATGQVPRFHLVREMSGEPGERPYVADTLPRAILELDGRNVAVARRGMYEVVMGSEGTGRRARVDSVEVAGKTGSAQHPGDLTHALFICFAPFDNPEIAVAVILENRGGGGAFAAPVAHAVLDHYFHPDRYKAAPDSTAAATAVAGVSPGAGGEADTLDDVPRGDIP